MRRRDIESLSCTLSLFCLLLATGSCAMSWRRTTREGGGAIMSSMGRTRSEVEGRRVDANKEAGW